MTGWLPPHCFSAVLQGGRRTTISRKEAVMAEAPWKQVSAVSRKVFDSYGREVACARDPSTAARIVLAVNGHDALVETAEAIVSSWDQGRNSGQQYSEAVQLARKAVAKG